MQRYMRTCDRCGVVTETEIGNLPNGWRLVILDPQRSYPESGSLEGRAWDACPDCAEAVRALMQQSSGE